jgi:hypothetical protein
MHRTLAILSSLAAVIGAMGCSSSSPAPGPSCATATVSFKSDVIPVFQQSCTLSMVCHGQMNNSAEESLYLGENMGTTDPNAVYNMLVGVKAKEIPSMNLVTAGDLENSFLWHKVNDSMTTLNADPLASQCAMATAKCTDCNMSQPCGATMPYLGAALDPKFACTLQNWIEGGAKND